MGCKWGYYLLLLGLFSVQGAWGQEFRTITQGVYWLGLGLDVQVTEHGQFHYAIEERRFAFPDGASQRLFGDFAWREKRRHWTFEGGLWFFRLTRPQDPRVEDNWHQKELRPYLGIERRVETKGKGYWRLRWKNEYRFFYPQENNRFLEPVNLREVFRTRVRALYCLDLAGNWQWRIGEELHLNLFGNQSGFAFQQNRLLSGFTKQFNKRLSLYLGYVYWFQPTGNTAEFYSRHILAIEGTYRIQRRSVK